jgi:hypothetical protein
MQILILVINLEDKLTTAISNVHKAIYDKDILKLNTELNEEKVKSHVGMSGSISLGCKATVFND